MKRTGNRKLLLGLGVFVATLPFWMRAADLSQLVTQTAQWESGQSREPLQRIEQLTREAAADKKLRAELEAALVQLLAPTATFEARRFACQQLAVIGSDASVPALARLLRDNQTTGIACLAFGNRPSAKADQALRAALTAAQGPARLQIISTLGDRRDPKAVKPLASLARDADAAVADTAIRALGKIANDAAARVIADLRKRATPPFSSALADASLRCAAHFAASGKRQTAAAIYADLAAPAQSAHVRRGAFRALLALDADGGEQRALQAVRGSDAVLKPVAIAAVASLPAQDASKTFAPELPRLSAPEQIWLIEALAVRADAPARSAIIGSLTSSEGGVRRAAAAALGRIGGATAVGPLARALAAAKDDEEIRALVAALGSLPADRDMDNAIASEVNAAKGEARARLISSLVNRRSAQTVSLLLTEADNPDPVVAVAAYRALARAATGDRLAALLKKYATLANPEIRSDIEGFAEQAVMATDDVAVRSAAVREALAAARGGEARCAVLSLLPAAGDAAALSALLAAVNGSNAQERDCAVHALSQWPDMQAWDALYGIFRQPLNEAYRSITLRSLVRLLGDANAHPDDALVAHYQELLDHARDAADYKQILGALGGAAHPEALKLATALLDKPGVQAEARAAVKKIAEALKVKPVGAAK
jgi:HEAT repeat protein